MSISAIHSAGFSQPQFSGSAQSTLSIKPGPIKASSAIEAKPDGFQRQTEDPTKAVFQYDPYRIYSPSGKLSVGQKICTFLIRDVYQNLTRRTVYKKGQPCIFHKQGKPSCSEYTLIAIQKFGVLKGIGLGSIRIARCNPLTKDFNDAVPVT